MRSYSRSFSGPKTAGVRHTPSPIPPPKARARSSPAGAVYRFFAVRVQAGAEFYTEWRDYLGDGDSRYVVGPSLLFRQGKVIAQTRVKKEDGSFQGNERLIAELPADTWAQVTVTAGMGNRSTGLWSVKVGRVGQPDVAVTDLLLSSDSFHALEWLGFVSTATSSVAYYLDDFVFEERK